MTLENDDVRKIVTWVVDEDLSTKQAAKDFDVSQRRIQQLAKKYREIGKIPMLKKRGRKPYADYPEDIEERIIQACKELQMGATLIARYLRKKYDIKIADNKVHEVLLENNMARENDNKKGRKKRRNWKFLLTLGQRPRETLGQVRKESQSLSCSYGLASKQIW